MLLFFYMTEFDLDLYFFKKMHLKASLSSQYIKNVAFIFAFLLGKDIGVAYMGKENFILQHPLPFYSTVLVDICLLSERGAVNTQPFS